MANVLTVVHDEVAAFGIVLRVRKDIAGGVEFYG